MNSLDINKKTPSLIVWIVSVTVIILAFGLPFLATDGTEKFSGKELQLAKEAISSGYYGNLNTNPSLDLEIGFKGKVVKVYKHKTNKRCSNDGQGYVYMADINKITFFGIEKPGYTTWLCSLDDE